MYQELALAQLVQASGVDGDASAAVPGRYDSRFTHWDERASVRSKPRRFLDRQESETLYFPPELLPIVEHPLVRARGPHVIRELLVHRLYDYLHFTTELEEIAVIPVASKISRGRAGLHLPEDMRGDAFKIVTDEAWHAQFSYDLVREVEHETGIHWDHSFLPAFVGRLDAIRMRLPSELRGAEGLLFSVVSETLISNILADLPRDQRLPRAVRDLVRDHAEDEGRHHVYFRTLLRYFWPALSRRERRTIGPFLPHIILAFLEPDYAAIGRSLQLVGHSVAEVEQIITETWTAGRAASDAAGAAGSIMKYLTEVGALDDPETADAFASSGLLRG